MNIVLRSSVHFYVSKCQAFHLHFVPIQDYICQTDRQMFLCVRVCTSGCPLAEKALYGGTIFEISS